MNGTVSKRWVEGVFLPLVRAFTDEKVALIVDNLASHADIDDPQLVLICLPPNSTALFRPLHSGAIQMLKGRYRRRRLLSAVDFLDGTSEAGAVSRARAAVESTGRVSLLDVTRIIYEEWASTTPESLARRWIKAKCLPAPMEATLRSMYHERDSADVGDMTAVVTQVLQRSTFTDGLFPDTDLVGLQSGVTAWLGAETEAEIVADMVDMAIGGEESQEEE
ncbi:hypothetical protein I4F81_005281 [Pyropia yezoensis]|uniref:Uncharacterized protein n=1 Tax=Pyropia yezoensis TaxID=2788 RepID=A0ACC3BXF1_PYRYE|nr:hypothetical protein I4F81_005281 [Neopyropia yezoensis]